MQLHLLTLLAKSAAMNREIQLPSWRVEVTLNVVNDRSASVSARFTSTDIAVKHRHNVVFNFVNDNEKALMFYGDFEKSPIIKQIIAL
jgi:hypothetical protein